MNNKLIYKMQINNEYQNKVKSQTIKLNRFKFTRMILTMKHEFY